MSRQRTEADYDQGCCCARIFRRLFSSKKKSDAKGGRGNNPLDPLVSPSAAGNDTNNSLCPQPGQAPITPGSDTSMAQLESHFSTTKRYTEDDFDFLRNLGTGGFGKVYLVQHKVSRRYFALKTMDKALLEDKGRPIDAFIERDIMSKLKHPNVLQLYGTFQSRDSLFYLMDYMPGGDLVHFLDRVPEKRVSLNDARHWSAQVFLGVTFMHAKGVIYRDLKPENMLLTYDGGLVLADFGLSKAFGDQQELMNAGATSVVGSPFYIAPEILDAPYNGTYDQSADWWSFGVLLYRLIYGKNPFTGRSKHELFENIRNQKLQFPVQPRIVGDKEARDLISRLLCREPQARIKSLEIGNHPFFKDVDWGQLGDGIIPVPECWRFPPTVEELLGRAEPKVPPSRDTRRSANSTQPYPGFTLQANLNDDGGK